MDDSNQPYQLEFDDRGEFIHATVSGKRVTREIALAYWRDIIDKCENTGCSKIFLDHNFEEMISMQEMVEVIGPVGEMLQGRLLSFYDRFGHYDIPEAGKMILRSHNVKMQIFHDIHEAERWLLANLISHTDRLHKTQRGPRQSVAANRGFRIFI